MLLLFKRRRDPSARSHRPTGLPDHYRAGKKTRSSSLIRQSKRRVIASDELMETRHESPAEQAASEGESIAAPHGLGSMAHAPHATHCFLRSHINRHRRMMRFPIAVGSLNFVPQGKSMRRSLVNSRACFFAVLLIRGVHSAAYQGQNPSRPSSGCSRGRRRGVCRASLL